MKRVLKWIVGVVALLLVLLVALGLYVQLTWDKPDSRPAPQMTAPRDSATVARGEHIFKYSWHCWGCHAASGGDGNAPPSGGFVFDLRDIGPGFGVYYSRNLTPDSATGLGGWTDGEIVQAIREGITHDRRMLFPLMPVDWLKGMSDQDVLAVVAYLRSLPPVSNPVPEREVSFVAKALMTFKIIKPIEPITAPVVAPPPGRTVEYGKYVASNLAGCADCHSPRNFQDGSFYMDSLFAGGNFPFGKDEGGPLYAFARNLRPEPETGIKNWTEEQFMQAVTTGMRPDSTVLTPHMGYPYYKFLREEDLLAVFDFLMSLPPMRRTTPAVGSSDELLQAKGAARGTLQFRGRCQACHGEAGKGAVPTNVTLAEVASSLNDNELRDFIASGQMNLKMPPFGKTLSREELDDIVSYIRSWERR
jgi:mono/diheme cytochrome c family protein